MQEEARLGVRGQNRSAMGPALPLIKLCDHRSIKNIWKKETLCRGMFGQAKASFLVSNPREQRICTIGEVFRVLKSRIFRARSDGAHVVSRRAGDAGATEGVAPLAGDTN